MNSESRTGRIIGALLIVQLAGLIVPFVMLMPITARPPENVTNAAVISSQLKLAVFLLFANCCLTIGISALVSRVIRQFGTTLPILLGATSLIMFTTQAVDNVQIMAMMSLGRHFADVGGDEALRTAAAVVGSIRRWSHFSAIVAIDGWMFVFYVCLYRFRIVPRGLPVFGLLTVVLHFTGIVVPLWFEVPGIVPMGAAMGVGHVLTGLWLVIKGFQKRGRND